MNNSPAYLQTIYENRFKKTAAYRNRVWQILTKSFFGNWIPKHSTILDLGCGYGEFINNIEAGKKFAIDLNPHSRECLAKDVVFFEQDCSAQWPVASNSLDSVFTSNFFEHLPDKKALRDTLTQVSRGLRPGGILIAMGPNIKFLPGSYWDFFDHHVMLTELALSEALVAEGFVIKAAIPRFLPYTLVNAPEYPLWILKLYLRLPFLWWIKGRQFLVIAEKRNAGQ